VQDGRFNNAPRVDIDPWAAGVRLAWKAQIGTDSSTRQIAVGSWYVLSQPPVWALQDLTSNVSSKEYPDIAVASDSVTHVVWREAVGPGDWQIQYATDRSGVWSAPRQLTFDATVKGAARIAVPDTSGIVHIAYSTLESGTSNDEIWYLLYDTLADTTAFLQITDDDVTDDDAQIAASDSVVSIAWTAGGFSGAIRCVEGDLSGFSEVPTGVTSGASQPDLAAWFPDRQHIVYRQDLGGGIRQIRYLKRSGAGFAAPDDVSPADALYSEPSLLVAFYELITVVYVSNTAGHEGFYVTNPGLGGDPPYPLMSDPTVTYNETDVAFLFNTIGLPGSPGRGGGAGYAVVSTGYVEADTVRADLHMFVGSVLSTGAPIPPVAPAGLSLAARPNPFLGATDVSFVLAAAGVRVRVDVIDVTGRRVAVLADGPRAAGPHTVRWVPGRVPAGVYWLRVDTDGLSESVAVRRLR